jgi:beta-glucosidase
MEPLHGPGEFAPERFFAKDIHETFNYAVPEALETGELKLKIWVLLDLHERIDGLAGTQDFLGVNYYSRDLLSIDFAGPTAPFGLHTPPGAATSDMGWEIYPQGFYSVLRTLQARYPHRTLFVTENGIADAKDRERGRFIQWHLAALHAAISKGARVEGYCHWSLMDNFEWNEGFAPRFGLYEMNYETFERTPRPSS